MSALTLHLNRSKRSVAPDLASPGGRGELDALVEGADAIVCNLRPAARSRLGLDWEAVHARNPRAVLCTAQGFASSSALADAPAYDDVIQARSGGADLYRRAHGEPRYSPSIVADKVCGLVIVQSVLSALLHVQAGGAAQWVDVPMADTMLAFNLVEHLSGATFDPPLGPVGWARTLAPERAPQRARDGWVCLMPYTDRDWTAFFAAVERPDLAADPRFASAGDRHEHNGALQAALAGIVAGRGVGEWLELCAQLGIAAGEVLDLDHVDEDPYFAERGSLGGAIHPTEGAYRQLRHPVDFSATPVGDFAPAPRAGEHTGAGWRPRERPAGP
jgi:crotonobetainyl-CoA:carnitine CoA-transferase CaiB-like acyl-CoA transferase